MKNVTKILTAAVFCAALFASDQRIDALGGNAAFWPGDEANIALFPAQVNNHSFLQFDGVGTVCNSWTVDGDCDGYATDTGGASLLINKDGTAWGFNYAEDDADGSDWVNMAWGNGDMGVNVGMQGGDTDGDMSVSWGGSFNFGELGVHLGMPGGEDLQNTDASAPNYDVNAPDDIDEYAQTLGVAWRKDCGFWIFDNAVVVAPDLMADDLMFSANMFSHHDAGGADVMFAWGMNYDGSKDGGIDQTATIGVEANMTDWATVRAGYNWTYGLTCDETNCTNGGTMDAFSWGLGFNWGGLTADMSVTSGLFQDPVGAVTGYDDGGLTNSAVTLTYNF